MVTESRKETTTGTLGEWRWVEEWTLDLYCPDIVRVLSSRLIGLQGVCTSWDSGHLDPAAADLPGWYVKGGHAVSPPITARLAGAWPESSCGFDEWYFFDSVPDITGLQAICSWGVTLGEAPQLREVPTGFDLQAQLDSYQPRLVVGDGRRMFALTRDEDVVADVMGELQRRRTSGCS